MADDADCAMDLVSHAARSSSARDGAGSRAFASCAKQDQCVIARRRADAMRDATWGRFGGLVAERMHRAPRMISAAADAEGAS
jgi:hypothetical protein